MLFPPDAGPTTTALELVLDDDGFPHLLGAGLLGPDESGLPVTAGPALPLLGEHSRELFTRPHLRGRRSGGRDWSTRFQGRGVEVVDGVLRAALVDPTAGLELLTEAESLPGGGLRLRHTLTNRGEDDYLLDGLEVVLPAAEDLLEVLDLTGRHEAERSPQRHLVTDGLWLRETRHGRPGLGSPTLVALGVPGFSTTRGRVLALHVAWSGNSVLRVERDPQHGTTVGGGELLQPGEVTLAPAESYATPWVHLAAADDGLDGVAAQWHAHQRTPRCPPGGAAGDPQRVGGGLLRPRPPPPARPRRPGRVGGGGALRPGRRLVPRSP